MNDSSSCRAASRGSVAPGFTLLEVLVAVTILGILLMTIYGAVSRTIRTKEHAEKVAQLSSVGREAVLRIADEMEASLAPLRVPGAVFTGVGAGSGQFLDQVRFTVSSRPPFGPIGGTGGRIVVDYYLTEQEGSPNTFLLARAEQPLPSMLGDAGDGDDEGDGDEVDEGDGATFGDAGEPRILRTLVVDNVAGLRLRYLDGETGQWGENWDSYAEGETQNRLPLAVEVALFLYDDNGGLHDYVTIVDLPLATRPTPTPER